MEPDEFERGIKAIEAAKGKKYTVPEYKDFLRTLYDDFKALTVGSWLEICEALRLSPKPALPILGQFWEVRRQASNLKYETGGRSVCGQCKRGIRYWLVEGPELDGETIRHALARCNCLAGQKWTGLPKMADVGKRGDFRGWIDQGIPEEAVASARKKGLDKES